MIDSGDEFERITASVAATSFNPDGTPASFDTRSDNKGPEPEGLVVAEILGRTYAFVGLERIGGFMVYDVTDPGAASFGAYERGLFSVVPEPGTAVLLLGGLSARQRKRS